MKNAINYDLTNKGKIFQWNNRKDFIDDSNSVFNKKGNDVCILFVCCNSFKLFDKCLNYLKKESNQNFDILVVDNSTDKENIELFNKIGNTNEKISILKPIGNIGGSGGFSIGMEYIIDKKYKYMIIFEDDIIPVDDNIISSTISLLNKNSIVQSQYINTYNSIFIQGGVFHLSSYPVSFINKIGVSNPVFFLKGDDAELETRITSEIKKGNIKIQNTGKYFFHPHQKKDGWKNRVLAFSIRNYLHILGTSFSSWRLIRNLKEQFLYIRYGLSKWFVEGCFGVIRIYFCSVLDFLFENIGYQENLNLMAKYKNIEITKPKTEKIEVKQAEINKYTKDKYYLYAKIMGHDNLFGKINYSNKLLDGINNGVIVGGIYNPIYPVCFFFKKILFLEEYDYENNIIKAELFTNEHYFLTVIKIIIAFVFSIIIYVPIIIVILFTSLIKNISK